MSFRRDIFRFLCTDQVGKLILGNARSGVRGGLYTQSQLIDYFIRACDLACEPATSDRETTDAFVNAISDLRMTPFRPGHRREIRTESIELPHFNTVDLTRQTLFHVTELASLAFWMDDEDKARLAGLGFGIPSDGEPLVPDEFMEQYEALPTDDRGFHLKSGVTLGRSLFWFFEDKIIEPPLVVSEVLAGVHANSAQSSLGLGRYTEGKWLALLEIPGAALQNAGHFRPTFCDAGNYRWFMLASSKPRVAASSEWGQTCNLSRLNLGEPDYDGRSERVSVQPWLEHFDGKQLKFEIIGPVTNNSGTMRAAKRLSDEVWSRRRTA